MDTTASTKNVFKKASAPSADLSAQIALTVEKRPFERIRVRRVFGDFYRCNWIAPDRSDRDLSHIESFRIRDSKLLRVIDSPAGLLIEDATAKAASN